MCKIYTITSKVTYRAVRKAMEGEPYTMSLTDTYEIRAVIEAVYIGIDSHLEGCFCSELGDRYKGGKRMAGKRLLCRTLECVVSIDSLPVLVRRLFELRNVGDDVLDAARRLAGDILLTLGFDEFGKFVDRKALGLE